MPRQQQIPGTEPPEHPDIVEAAEAYVEARDERMEKTKVETQRHGSLLAVMRSHAVERHRFRGRDGTPLEAVIDTPEARVKVRKTGEPDVDDEDVDKMAAIASLLPEELA